MRRAFERGYQEEAHDKSRQDLYKTIERHWSAKGGKTNEETLELTMTIPAEARDW